MPRRPIADMISDIDAQAAPAETPPQPPAEPGPAAGEPEPPTPARSQRPRGAHASGLRRAPGGRPSARDLAAPARQNIPREALKVDVPAELALLQRLRRRRLDTGMDIRDQVAIAVDEWLTAEGY